MFPPFRHYMAALAQFGPDDTPSFGLVADWEFSAQADVLSMCNFYAYKLSRDEIRGQLSALTRALGSV